jgi:hypothetical protein
VDQIVAAKKICPPPTPKIMNAVWRCGRPEEVQVCYRLKIDKDECKHKYGRVQLPNGYRKFMNSTYASLRGNRLNFKVLYDRMIASSYPGEAYRTSTNRLSSGYAWAKEDAAPLWSWYARACRCEFFHTSFSVAMGSIKIVETGGSRRISHRRITSTSGQTVSCRDSPKGHSTFSTTLISIVWTEGIAAAAKAEPSPDAKRDGNDSK